MSDFPVMPCETYTARDVFDGAKDHAGSNRRKHTRAKCIIASIAGILCIAGVVVLTACCASAPRAIIPPPAEISKLDVKPVVDASGKTRDAFREIGTAGEASRTANANLSATAARLSAEIDRAQRLAIANRELQEAFENIRAINAELSEDSARLTASLRLAQEKETLAIATIDALDQHISTLQSKIASQSTAIDNAAANERTLRAQVEALAALPDKLAILTDKLGWWRNAALLTWGLIAAYIILRVFGTAMGTYIRTRIPI